MLLAETVVLVYSELISEYNKTYYIDEQVLKLQDIYFEKIKVKREVQNILNSDIPGDNPYDRIERIAKKLEQYEPVAENNENYRVDIWCGYVDSQMLKAMLD
ncbi:MAG: hypothetical protein ACP5KK_03470, partial [Candidatus Nanoarchaeia archaeon]